MLICVCLICLVAGLVQTVTGFGAGIIDMLVFPYFFSITQSSGINGVINLVLNVALVATYWKHINFKKILFPTIISIVVSTLAIKMAIYLPVASLKIAFSIFMILLAIYFNFFNKVEIKDTPISMSICSGIAGLTNGLFSIAGPTMVVYYLAATKEKEEYIGTIQAFFLMSSISATVMRIVNGIITKEFVLPIGIGIVAILAGKVIGSKIVDKIPAEKMKKCIYIFLGIVGVIQLIQCL